MPQPDQVTAAEISRLAGVTRATVSNWRRRHPDFPAPSGGTEASPAYDLAAVRAWLAARGQLPASSPADELRAALRESATEPAHRSRLLPLVVAASHIADTMLAEAVELTDAELAEWSQLATQAYAENIPGVTDLRYQSDEADLLRTVLRCVAAEGGTRTLAVFADGEIVGTRVSGHYQTEETIAELMADLLATPGEAYPEKVFDPACGAGALLLAAAHRGARELSGQEIVPLVAAHAAAVLALADERARPQIQVGDSLHDDEFPELVADAVLCAPPFGHRDWGQEELAYDSRWVFGLPAKSESELAWMQHCFAHLAPGARAVLLMPPGAAFRPSGRRIRAELVRSGALRAVVALPAGVAQPLHIALQLWLLERSHPQAAPPSAVLLIDTAAPDPHRAEEVAGRHPRSDWSTVRDAVLDAWRDFDRHPDGFDPVPGTARAVPILDLIDEAVDLTPARHVRAAPVPTRPDELAELAYQLRGRLRRAATGLVSLSGGEPWPPAGAAPLAWRSASVADLLRGDALTMLRASTAAIRDSSPALPEGTGPRTLTARDVVSRRPASGVAEEELTGEDVPIEEGDVILPELLHGGAGTARVADAGDAGHLLGRGLYLLRPDPARLDPWFLAGFLSAEDNLSAASSGTSVVRVDPRRLRVPLLPLAEQQRYGRAFRQLSAVRTAADIAHRLADETARTLAAGLTGGALLPPTVEGTR